MSHQEKRFRGWRAVGILVAVYWLVGAARPGLAADPVRIVEDGKPRATIVLPDKADAQTRAAAELLAEYVKRSSGAELPVATQEANASSDQPVTIHVGRDAYVNGLDLGLDSLDADGFVIRAADGHVTIAGPTPWGTEFGVCEFLETYVGVRWLMPGPCGDDVPQHAAIEVPAGEVRREPVFFSRLMSGLHGGAQAAWARRNRMHGRVDFHHNLHRLFPPETYTKTHPEFYPLRGGERYFPATNNTHGWQPCFSAPGIVDEAVANICRYFDEHPEATSYSLGVVDSSGYCECDACRAKDPQEPNFLGRRDCSDRYYAWCNEVIQRVLRKHPDKVFGCLAYSEVAQPPSRVRVHERLVPFMTYDRMKWADPEIRAEGERLTRWWHDVSPVVGWYDYIYGWTYCVPRVYFHEMADYYRFAKANGVRAMYAEAYPNFGEGPKLYVALKLQWDPDRDVDRLLRDWYVRTVGEEAADDLAAYYALWEDFWTRRVLESDWFTERGQYLRFYDPSYLADVTDEDVARCRELMDAVVRKAKTPGQKGRAELLAKAFEYYEASAVAYSGNRWAREASVTSEADALAVLDRAERCLTMAAKRKRLIEEELPKYPHLMLPIDTDRYPSLRGDDWGTVPIWLAYGWAKRSDAVRARLAELAASPTDAVSLAAKTMLATLDEKSKPVSKDPSFEEPQDRWPAAWSPWVKWATGTMTAGPEAARSGSQGVVCRGMRRGGPHQTVEVPPGRYAAVAFVRVPKEPKQSATVTLAMTPIDPDGNNLPEISTTMRAGKCDWTALATAGEIPAQIRGKPVDRVRLIVIVDGFAPGEEVHVDDVAMFPVP